MSTDHTTCPSGRTRYRDHIAAHYALPVRQQGRQDGEDCGDCGGVHLPEQQPGRQGEREK